MSEPTNTAASTTAVPGLVAAAQAQAAAKAAEAAPATPAAPQGDPGDADLGEGGKKALKAEREARTTAERRAAEFKAKLDQLEAANMSELERANKKAEDAQAETAKAQTDALRFRVASQYGISEEDAELFLTGSDADTLTKQATRLKDRTPTAPRPDPTQGAQTAQPLNGDGLTEALARAVGAR